MSINMNRATERPLALEKTGSEGYKPRFEKDRLTEHGSLAKKNLTAKRAMSSELASMGLSQYAIDRLLHLKGKANVKRPES